MVLEEIATCNLDFDGTFKWWEYSGEETLEAPPASKWQFDSPKWRSLKPLLRSLMVEKTRSL